MLMMLAAATGAVAGPVPHRIGHCVATRISAADFRLESDPASGSSVVYADGVRGVSYDRVPGVSASRPGDPVRLCLASVPHHCPPGDDRGRFYRATNLRTGARWRLSDSEHLCGGA